MSELQIFRPQTDIGQRLQDVFPQIIDIDPRTITPEQASELEVQFVYGERHDNQEVIALGERPSFYMEIQDTDEDIPPQISRVTILNELRSMGILCNLFGNDISGIALQPEHVQILTEYAETRGHRTVFGVHHIPEQENATDTALLRRFTTTVITDGKEFDYTSGGIIAAKRGIDYRDADGKPLENGRVVVHGLPYTNTCGGIYFPSKQHDFIAFTQDDITTNEQLPLTWDSMFEQPAPELPAYFFELEDPYALKHTMMGDTRETESYLQFFTEEDEDARASRIVEIEEMRPRLFVLDMKSSSNVLLGADTRSSVALRRHWLAFNETLVEFMTREEARHNALGIQRPFHFSKVEETSECLALLLGNREDMDTATQIYGMVIDALLPVIEALPYFQQTRVVETAQQPITVSTNNRGRVVFADSLPLHSITEKQRLFDTILLHEADPRARHGVHLENPLFYTRPQAVTVPAASTQ